VVGKLASADAPDHRRVPPHQCFQRNLVSPPNEALHQLAVGLFCRLSAQLGSAKKVQERNDGIGCHNFFPRLEDS
jgi:hypothetical protein